MKGRTYRYMTQDPLFPFGFGLSYSRFEYSDLKIDRSEIIPGESLDVHFTIQNCGDRRAAEVVQVYLSDLQASTIVPLHHLVGFERVVLEAGESRTLKFTITPEMMSFYNDDGKLTLELGEFRIEVGGCSPGKRGRELGAPNPVNADFNVK
jgi:beta-glucosidase